MSANGLLLRWWQRFAPRPHFYTDVRLQISSLRLGILVNILPPTSLLLGDMFRKANAVAWAKQGLRAVELAATAHQ